MQTKAIKSYIAKHPGTSTQTAIARLNAITIADLATKHSLSLSEAKSLHRLKVYNAAIDAEINLRNFLNTISPKSAKRPRGSPQRERLAIPLITERIGDILWTIDRRTIVVESKQRSYPGTLYDSIVTTNTSRHVVNGVSTVWYVLTETDLRNLVANKVPPKLLQQPFASMQQYKNLFETTKYKQATIDILCLTQKQFPLVFFVRPNTYDLLLSRCNGNVITNDSQSTDDAIEMLKFCIAEYPHKLSNKLCTSEIEIHDIIQGEQRISQYTYRLLAKLYAKLRQKTTLSKA